ncbi:MAG TPA: SpaA isopeptide-forming pilin-related protein, partial [Pseudoflavonifractor sp.]|nr:SpaA isopeptide-forming pilin-related protein [Pseudoflavonifractor sp.]
ANDTIKLAGAKFQLKNAANKYAQVDVNGKLTGWVDTEATATTLVSAEDTGIFKVIGLDDGIYTLTEIEAPIGYNKLADSIKVVITAGTVHNTEWISDNTSDALRTLTVAVDSGEAKDGVLSTGTVAITIANNKGATLPSTGGVGTTIFYAVGGVLMLGAVVLLITKKRIGGK